MQVVYLIDDGIKLREDLNNRFAEDKIYTTITIDDITSLANPTLICAESS